MLRRIKTELQVGGGNQKTKTITQQQQKTLVKHDGLPRHDLINRVCSRMPPNKLRAPIVIMDNDVVYCPRCKLLKDVFIASMACSNCPQWQTRLILSLFVSVHHTPLTSDTDADDDVDADALHVSHAVLFVRVLRFRGNAALEQQSNRAVEQHQQHFAKWAG